MDAYNRKPADEPEQPPEAREHDEGRSDDESHEPASAHESTVGDSDTSDPALDPHMDIRRWPQDPQARQPGERLKSWLARRCSRRDGAPPQEGDEPRLPEVRSR